MRNYARWYLRDPAVAELFGFMDVRQAALEYHIVEDDTLWDLSNAFTGSGSNFQSIQSISELSGAPIGTSVGSIATDEAHEEQVFEGPPTVSSELYAQIQTGTVDAIERPESISPGLKVLIPLQVSDWKHITVQRNNLQDLSQKLYGDMRFSKLLMGLCEVTELPSACVVPTFHETEVVRRALRLQ